MLTANRTGSRFWLAAGCQLNLQQSPLRAVLYGYLLFVLIEILIDWTGQAVVFAQGEPGVFVSK